MDVLSVTASVIAVVQLAGTVISYLADVKAAPKDCQRCIIETSNLQTLLINPRYRLEERKGDELRFSVAGELLVKNGPLEQYRQALEDLQPKLDAGNNASKIMKKLRWTLSKEEVANILARLERLKTLVSIALDMDHFMLSEAIKNDVNSVRNSLPILQAGVAAVRDGQSLHQHHRITKWLSG